MQRFKSLYWRLFGACVLITAIGMLTLVAAAHLIVLADVGALAGGRPTPGASITPVLFSIIDQSALIAAGVALAVAAICSTYIAWRMVRPILALSEASEQIALGNYTVRVEAGTGDELAALARTINHLAQTLDQTELRRMALITDVAHELRTPLMTIDSYVEGMIDGVIGVEPANLTLIQRETTRMRRLVADLSLLSRAEAGQLPVQLQPTELAGLVAYLAAQIGPQCEDEDIRLAIDIRPGLPAVLADPQRIEQVLINVLVNALRYSQAGGSIQIGAEQVGQGVRLAVRDSGVGIAAEDLGRIFDRFYRVEDAQTDRRGGTGVGLTIARHLMRAQGGEIWAESYGRGAGATFVITLPLA